MIETSLQRLEYLCEVIPAALSELDEAALSERPPGGGWSRKEIMGHLLDSATNNHQRFIRCQFENTPYIVYDQDNWNIHSHYQQIPAREIISFWKTYNLFLVRVLKNIPSEKLLSTCSSGEKEPVTIGWLFNDYVIHMEHHLRQIVDYQ